MRDLGPLARAMAERVAGTPRGPLMEECHAVPQNPHAWDDGWVDSFRVAVPVSGGMESLTLWTLAEEQHGDAAIPYFLRLGQPYQAPEEALARAAVGDRLAVLEAAWVCWTTYDHILAGRNALIAAAGADLIGRRCWGEVWLGNLAGESPPAGGDKSVRFRMLVNAELAPAGVQLTSPLLAWCKVDVIRWWSRRGELDRLRRTKSCFHPTLRACGRCRSCFRRWVAWRCAGEQDGPWDQNPQMEEYAAEYRDKLGHALAAQDFTHYTRSRVEGTLAVLARDGAEVAA